MITYRELSSLTQDLGFSAKTLYSVSNHIEKHYRKAIIPKQNGDDRELCVPDELLKSIQRSIVNNLLLYERISPYAMAYREGGSTLKNARPHIGAPVILKLDIKHFFDHIVYPVVKDKVFSGERYSEENRILLTILCIYKDSLPQGAPTSPIISNIILKDFDDAIGAWCKARGIRYTRYCDDMTFSGDFDPKETILMVKTELKKMGFFLNDKKTIIVRNGQKKIVTGIVINEKINVPVEYRKNIRQEIYYCKKFGIAEHIRHSNLDSDEMAYLRKLLGKVNYVLSVDKTNKEMQEYKKWLIEQLKSM